MIKSEALENPGLMYRAKWISPYPSISEDLNYDTIFNITFGEGLYGSDGWWILFC